MANEYKEVISDKKKEATRMMTGEQLKSCSIAIHTASVAAGAAGVIPVPVADAVPITGAQVTMAIALGKVFDKTLTESAAKALISAAATTFVGRALVKLIPVAGWIASAAVAAGVTEAIGWTLAVEFASEYKKSCHNSVNTYEEVVNEVQENQNDDVDEDGMSSEDDSLSKDIEDCFGEEEN